MKLLKEYDAESILSEEVFTEIFNEPDEIQKARMLLSSRNVQSSWIKNIKAH